MSISLNLNNIFRLSQTALCLFAIHFVYGSNNTAVPVSTKSAPVSKNDKKPLDFTLLPIELQNLIIGYLGSGWHKIDTASAPSNLYDLYYFKDRILVAIGYKTTKPIIFGESINQEFVQSVEGLLNDSINFTDTVDIQAGSPGRRHKECGNTVWYSKNYRACQQFYGFSLKKIGPDAKNIVSYVHGSADVYNFFQHFPFSVCFSTDEQYFAVARSGGDIEIFDLRNGNLVKLIKNQKSTAIVFSPDNKHLLCAYKNDFIAHIDIASGNKTIIQSEYDNGKESYIRGLAFSPDGKYFVAGRDADDGESQVMKFEFQPDLDDKGK